MDLSSVLNTTNSAPEPKPSLSSSPVAQRSAQPPSFPPPPSANGPSPSYAQYPSHQTTPQYAPPSQEHRSPTGSVGYHGAGAAATPLQTPSHAGHGHGQYPFPQHPSQSPVATHPGQQQHQSYPAHSSVTPGSRPMSHGYQQPPTQMAPSGVPAGFQQYSSHSPTPPSHHGQTPHSVRQSPLATFAHPPQPPSTQQYPYQQSQPSTPLGPPSLQHQRTSGHGSHPELFSPSHHRHFSGASNGIAAGSPAQHHPSVGNLIDSPSAYNRQSPQVRRTSDYLSQGERERSLSVSPKTKVVPRLPSHGSRHSSVNEGYSARSSIHANGPHSQPYDTQGHVQSPVAGRHAGAAQPSFAHSASDVSQAASRSSQVLHSDAPTQPAPQTPLFPSAAPPQHHSQKMGMNHLLTPARETETSPHMQSHDHSDNMSRKHSIEQVASSVQSSSRAQSPQDARHDAGPQTLLQQPVQHVAAPNGVSEPRSESRKRPASSGLVSEPPMKREKKRKYVQRPIWATLSKSNPNFDGTNGLNGQNGRPSVRQQQQQQQQHQRQPPQQARGNPQPAALPQPHQYPNGTSHINGAPAQAPQDQPLDEDLILARSILGPWEKSIKWNVPTPSLLRLVQDWFWQQLEANSDIGNDPRTGAIEIEAKIGTLVRSGEHDRARMEGMNMQIINPTLNKNFRFESRMEEPEHKAMNNFLNTATQQSHAAGRVPVQYEHLYQTDTFAKLSPAGIAALPPIVQQRNHLHGRELRLRTSRNSKDNTIIARIIKVPLGDLHIANPLDPYDCRISINLEVNLDRPDLNPDDLIEAPTHDRPAPPERKKDRLSYKHLAYSIDLTKVESAGVPPKYELELEVDAGVLRSQIAMIKSGQKAAYSSVVSGFLDNATYLMRQAPQSS